MKFLLPVLVILLLGPYFEHAYGNVHCPSGNVSVQNPVEIYDTITEADVQSLKQCYESNEDPVHSQAILNSHGGDVYSAMQLGHLLRKYRISATVPNTYKCLSACVLVLAGGTYKAIVGEVGIHRPYSLDTGQKDFDEVQRQYRKIRKDVEEYLFEMNLPESFFTVMDRTPPEEMRILSESELKQYGLSGSDPVQQEVSDSRKAGLIGISKSEYYKRKRASENNCSIPSEMSNEAIGKWMACQGGIMWGIGPQEWWDRSNISAKECKAYDVSSNQWRECKRWIMSGNR